MLRLILLISLVTLASATFVDRHFPQRFASSHAPEGWTKLAEKPSDETKLSFVVALKIRNLEQLTAKALSVSDPDNADYMNYLSNEQLADMIGPSFENLAEVLRWLNNHQVTEIDIAPTRELVKFITTLKQAEEIFQVPFARFEHKVTGRTVIRATTLYSIPKSLSDIVHVVSGVIGFQNAIITPFVSKQTNPNPAVSITPAVVRQYLNIPGTVQGASTKNLQAVASFLKEYMSPSDLAEFQSDNKLKKQPVSKIIGPNEASNPGYEGQLDIEYLMGIGVGVPTYYISTAGLHENQEPFLEWATALASMTPVPLVHSVSYGDYEYSIDVTFADAVDVQFIKLATRGVTIMFASGDSGAGCNKDCTNFVPNWPASDPWVTSVGGVYLRDTSMIGDTISSGGFSDIFEMPAYQTQAVKNYLSANANKLPPSKYFNTTGRAMPDVAAFSEDVIIKIFGGNMPIGGTSCACPIFSGMISLLNDVLLQNGKQPLGFLNPLLYKLAASNPNVFTDITQGTNSYGCCPGYSCATGWDPVTGLGVPNYTNLRSAIFSLLNIQGSM